jgi:hypothetical protein
MYSGAIPGDESFTQRMSFLHGPVRGERVGVVDSNVFEQRAGSRDQGAGSGEQTCWLIAHDEAFL